MEEAKDDAKVEGQRLLTAARAEIDQEVNRVKEGLRGQVVSIALAGAGKVLEREVDEATHAELLNKLAAEIYVNAYGRSNYRGTTLCACSVPVCQRAAHVERLVGDAVIAGSNHYRCHDVRGH